MLETQTQHSISTKTQPNILVNIATPLLTLMTQIKHTSEHHNVPKLRLQVIEEIKYFEQKLEKLSYPMRIIIAARYSLCTAIDEAVLSRSWGTQSIWVEQTLLSLFHKETWGGERFYIIIEDMAKNPRQNIDFLEFAYILLSLGFEGKYFGNHLVIREEIRNRIFYRIRYSKEKPDKTLSKNTRDQSLIQGRSHKTHKIRRIIITSCVVILCINLFYNISLSEKGTELLNQLNAIGNIAAVTTFAQVIQRPIVDRGMT